MSREIKFRAWDIDSSEMFYSNESRNCHDFFFEFEKGSLCLMMPKEEDYPEKRDAVIMQFSGIKDKKGEGIYEGDILKNRKFKCQVVFENGSYFLYHLDLKDWDKSNLKCGLLSNIHDVKDFFYFEIIGNIYQNPDLLIN